MSDGSRMPAEKSADLYALQIAASAEEKVEGVLQLVRADLSPRLRGKLNILEFGTGGGDSFRRLKNLLAGRDDIALMGLDSLGPFVRQFVQKVDASAVLAEAGLLPFGDHTLSAINASAIFHEVSTYGVHDLQGRMLRGNAALMQTMREITRSLLPGGVLVYRDVSCPNDREEVKRVVYREKSWRLFITKYLSGLIEVYQRVVGAFPEIDVQALGEGLHIEAPVQIHREIQRHYVTFRDYFRRVVAPANGIETIREEWVDPSAGIKRHFVLFSSRSRPLRVTLDSDTFDSLTDAVMCELFDSRALDDWFKREGAELYTLLSIDEMIDLTEQAVVETGRGLFKLTPRSSTARMSLRDYYLRYLRRVIDQPELETKQHLQFVSVQQ